jgi:hypothetical protein
MIDHMVASGFIRTDHRAMMIVSDCVVELLDALSANTGDPTLDKTERG